MIFLTYWFVFFAALALPLLWVTPWPRLRLVLVVATSAVFHGHFAGPAGVLPIVVVGVVTHLAALSGDRRAIRAAIALSVLSLVFYKYTYFLALSVVGLASPELGAWLAASARASLPIAPPLAISFFTFEFVHYLVDVERGSPPIASPLRFAAFAIFWPSIVSGPVKRYQQFLPALEAALERIDPSSVCAGTVRVAQGLLKKFVADNLAAYLAFYVPRFEHLGLFDRWVVLGAIGARILLDFSGYSDLAIGYARMLGVRLPENFDWPYLATSLQDFWRRWHISLSSWIRDYVYVPLGGGRRGPLRRALNGIGALTLCGLWHGPSWNFAIWGAYHGVGLAFAIGYRSALGPVGVAVGALFDRIPLVGWALTMLYVLFGWLLFFYPVETALRMVRLLFGAAA